MLSALIKAYKNHLIYTRTIDELSKLSDKELYDIGIERSHIASIAKTAYDEKDKINFNFFKNMFKVKSEKDIIEEYLAESVNAFDLENRLKMIDKGIAPWQIQKNVYAQGLMG